MKYLYFFVIINFLAQKAKCVTESYIVGGSFAKYNQFPHSVYLHVNCLEVSLCAGSILNQVLVLTAAHCVEDCTFKSNEIVRVKYGLGKIRKMKKTEMIKYAINENYDKYRLENDIGLILTKDTITLNEKVKRVILMSSPPTPKYAYVAGWGIDENGEAQTFKSTEVLMHTPEICLIYTAAVDGVFCGGPITGLGWPHSGDSGGGLMVNDTIQIGIVAYKVPNHRLTGYTNVSYFLKWINKAARKLYCHQSR